MPKKPRVETPEGGACTYPCVIFHTKDLCVSSTADGQPDAPEYVEGSSKDHFSDLPMDGEEEYSGIEGSDGDDSGDSETENDIETATGGKTVKPLSAAALAAFEKAQQQAGIIYISRIPPGMRPAKVKHLMSGYGKVGRVYLQQEGMSIY
jgi:ESF2/ABP1 family protein